MLNRSFTLKRLFTFFSPALVLLASSVSADQLLPIHVHLSNGKTKLIHVPRIMLDQEQRMAFYHNVQAKAVYKSLRQVSNPLPPQYENGMNGLPVFDQGAWGTCATFAATAALDALYNLSGERQISQLCNLQLGRTLRLPDRDGGWEGSFGFMVLGQISKYGYLPVSYQHNFGCGGLTEYPTYSEYNGYPMSKAAFTAQSIMNFTSKNWRTLEQFNEAFAPISPEKGDVILTDVKRALLKGHRVLFGTLLDVSKDDPGAVGAYNNAKEDAWVLAPEILQNIVSGEKVGGHEILITGYDDHACASYVDSNKQTKQECGLLHIRNSWSDVAGDRGDYYMSYDYFKMMVVEAYDVG